MNMNRETCQKGSRSTPLETKTKMNSKITHVVQILIMAKVPQ